MSQCFVKSTILATLTLCQAQTWAW